MLASESIARKEYIAVLRDCKKCGAIGLAVCACVVGQEIAGEVKAEKAEPVEPSRPTFIVFKMDDQAHIENEINAPPTARLPIRPAWTTTAVTMQMFEWNPIPPSVASAPSQILTGGPRNCINLACHLKTGPHNSAPPTAPRCPQEECNPLRFRPDRA
jgi:hypothetical protein